jgi:anti-sigma B factor antagonist
MQILTETFGDVVVAHTPDELTDDFAHLLANTLRRGVENGQNRIVLQMDRSDSFDSAGLGVLVDLHDSLRESGGGLKVCCLTEIGQKVFEIVRFNRRLDVFDSVIEAVNSFR